MKIATYNVNGINARLPNLLRWLNEEKPDIVCLQELKAPAEKIPAEAISNVGYKALWHGQKQWNGVAVLSKNAEINEVGRILKGDPEDVQSRYIEVDVNGIRIVCLYLPNGNPAPGPKFDYKLKWFKRFSERAQELIELDIPVVLCGDFNVIPTDLDVYKPERWRNDALFRPETRAAFQNLLSQGWTDAVRKIHPHEKIYTFWDYFRNAFVRDAGLRIDHFLLNEQLEKKLLAAGVDRNVRGWEKSSDHAPVWIEIEMEQ
ncbi:MAG TPA: exodeoxyribonuclease III [Flavobacteriaceae bacterium]|nr:exodeoxyribonuclease III [Flavobacteriaceae bacterium]